MTYSLVIPAYNESQRLALSLDRILRYAAEQRWQAEIIVVDDGSTDDTAQLVSSYARQNSTVRLLQNPGNKGKGYSVRHGMLEARGDVLLLTDADLSAPIAEAQKLFSAIARDADVAIGSRWLEKEACSWCGGTDRRCATAREFFAHGPPGRYIRAPDWRTASEPRQSGSVS